MQIKNLLNFLEEHAPPMYQESYDNAGLIVGDAAAELTGVLLCLDSVEAVIDEAIELGCNLVIAHHPIVFRGLKRLNGNNYVERVVIKAIKNDIAIYAIHTNLDNVLRQGVNTKICEKLGLINTRILQPKKGLRKLNVWVAPDQAEGLRQQLFAAGAGHSLNAHPQGFGQLGVQLDGARTTAIFQLEFSMRPDRERAVQKVLDGSGLPYEWSSIDVRNAEIGSGMIGELKDSMAERAFLEYLKKQMKAGCVRHTKLLRRRVNTVAVCGGAGGFLLNPAKAQGAQVFVTADYKYHEFFDADGQIVIADIGHYESEQYTGELLFDIISQKFSNFALHYTKVNTNPVNYL